MRIGYLHCFSGICGDMFLAALLDAGIDPELFHQTIAALGVNAELKIGRVDRSGISAIKVDVHDLDAARHHHNHHHHDHEHGEKHRGGEARGIAQIREMLHRATIDDRARQTALHAFELLAASEARIHNVPVEKIHFHEVGAVDAIVDITCAAVGCCALDVRRWVCSPLNVGGGTVVCAHGVFPVPAPATLDLLRDAPVYSSGVEVELVTPTGAALVRALECEFGAFPAMRPVANGYGAGSRVVAGIANVLRITIGEDESLFQPGDIPQETVAVLETTLDDVTPQVIGHVMNLALTAGALDIFCTPVQMKKNRPGHLLTLLCAPDDAGRMRDLLLTETTSLGVRVRHEQRSCLEREWVMVKTGWGELRVKAAYRNGSLMNCSPEYEDCRRIAEQHKVPLKLVIQEAVHRFYELRAHRAEGAH